jgi:MarR family transcriptional regulator, organic hydroperoxide resistance regulator
MSLERTLQIIQFAYPQIYLACHTRHQRKRSSAHQLSARDSSILAHLDQRQATTPAALASHLNVARSTLSEALKRLSALGYTEHMPRISTNGVRGGVGILLTAKGVAAIRETSVLEAPRLRAVLERLSPTELRTVSRAMSALAAACNPDTITKTTSKPKGKRKSS